MKNVIMAETVFESNARMSRQSRRYICERLRCHFQLKDIMSTAAELGNVLTTDLHTWTLEPR